MPAPPPPQTDAKARGIQLIKDAVAADTSGCWDDAITLYEQGTALLQMHAATETNPKFHTALTAKVNQYQARIHALHQARATAAHTPTTGPRPAHTRVHSADVAPAPPSQAVDGPGPLRTHGTGATQRSLQSRSSSTTLSQQDWRELAIGMPVRFLSCVGTLFS